MRNEKLNKALNLLERIDSNYKMLVEAKTIVKDVYYSPNEFMDMLEEIGDTSIISVGLIQASDLNMPIVKRKNPATNRMKGYPDYSSLVRDDVEFEDDVNDKEIVAIAKLTHYKIMYRKQEKLNKEYGDYKKKNSELNVKYGLPPIKDKENDYAEKTGYGNETKIYKGNNKEKEGNLYMSVNTARKMGQAAPAVYYLLNADGRVIRKMTEEEIKNYPPLYKDPSYVNALRKLGKDDTIINQYIEELKGLGKMKYRRFEFNHILYCGANVNGSKSVFINKNVSRNVDGVELNSQYFEGEAWKRYSVTG